MLRLGQKIVIVSDRFEQNLPVEECGYIIAYDRNADNVFDYIVRVPKTGKNYFVPDSDVIQEEVLLQMEAERVERESLIDFALATHNQGLFYKIMNGDQDDVELEVDSAKESVSQEEFIRQVNLKAWI